MRAISRGPAVPSSRHAVEGLLYLEHGIDVIAWGGETGAHRVHGQVGRADVAPLAGPLCPLRRPADGEAEPPMPRRQDDEAGHELRARGHGHREAEEDERLVERA